MTPDEEARHLAVAELELRNEFPDVPADAVRDAIDIERKAFETAKIRDYVPLLVTRDVRYRLRHHLVDQGSTKPRGWVIGDAVPGPRERQS